MHLGLIEYVHSEELIGLTHSKFVEGHHELKVAEGNKPIIDGQ